MDSINPSPERSSCAGWQHQVHAAGYREKVDSNPLLPLTDDSAIVKAASTQPDVIAASRRIQTGGLVSNSEGAFSLSIIGIEPEAEAPVSLIAEHIVDWTLSWNHR
jgi:ABC-type lipoprotein release transport system permease subunit